MQTLDKSIKEKIVLALDVDTIDEAKSKITVYNAEDGNLIITYDRVNLHNSIDPIREANTVWNKTIQYELGENDIQIVFTGLRPGEKLIEELLTEDSEGATEYPSITAAKESKMEYAKLQKELERLKNESDKLAVLKEIVPEFEHRLNGKS